MRMVACKNNEKRVAAAALGLLVVGMGLWLLGMPSWLELPLTLQAITAQAAGVQDASTLVEQGILARVQRGEIIGKEAFTLRRQGEGFVLLTTAEFQGARQGVDFEQRLATALPLTAGYRPEGYTLVQIVEWADDTPELMSAQIVFSDGEARAEARWTQPEPFTQARAWTLPDLPVALLQPNVMSHWMVLARLFAVWESTEGADELAVGWLHPFVEEVGTARLRRLGSATIVRNDTGEEIMAERLEVALEPTGEVAELIGKDREFWGAVAVGFGEDQAFIFRWDLFPEGFRVKR